MEDQMMSERTTRIVCRNCGQTGQGPDRGRCHECRKLFSLVADDGVSQAPNSVLACLPDGHVWFCSARCAAQYEYLRQADQRLAGKEPDTPKLIFPAAQPNTDEGAP